MSKGKIKGGKAAKKEETAAAKPAAAKPAEGKLEEVEEEEEEEGDGEEDAAGLDSGTPWRGGHREQALDRRLISSSTSARVYEHSP